MTARQRKDPRATGKVFSELGPHTSQSFYSSRTSKSENLPSIAGIGMGIQDVRSISIVPVTKGTKSFPITVRAEKPVKSVVSKVVQEETEYYLTEWQGCQYFWPALYIPSAKLLSWTAVTYILGDNFMDATIKIKVSSNEENLLLSKLEALEKEILSLKSYLTEKEDLVTELNEIIKTKTVQFTRDMEHEVSDHKTTRRTLEESQRMVQEKEQLLHERIQHYEKVIRELQDQHEEVMAKFQEQSQREVNARDERINKLKQQISELFKDKSREHQKQIEELQKELKRLAEEAQALRGQLKRHNVSTHECKKCESLMSALEDSRLQVKLKNRTIEELQSICQRFQHQLQEQEKLRSVLMDKTDRNQK
ncbi:uncharacterized protein [Phyllobates terribilis]|uniref:uncharacterized protein isoform X1 n=1 Tax=Phyllobates terribilis TaxID=111132 RepID=UPI003CCADD16